MNKLLCFLGVGWGRGNGGKVDVTSVEQCQGKQVDQDRQE